MVKKLIQGILGKKGDQSKKPAEEEVPDELPGLAEDTAKKAAPEEKKPVEKPEEKPKEEKKEEAPKKIEPPKKPEEKVKKEAPKELPKIEKKETPTDIPSIKKKPEQVQKEPDLIKQMEKEREQHKVNVDTASTAGYFSEVFDQIKQSGFKGQKEKIFNQDLFYKMSEFWGNKEVAVKEGKLLSPEQKLKQDIEAELNELKKMENQWQVQKLIIEEDKKLLHERERDIKTKINELKILSKELKYYQSVNDDQAFFLSDGTMIKSLQELHSILKKINNETFSRHVNGEKNDFSNWVKYVINERELADQIKNANSKEEISKFLKEFIS